VSFSCSAREVSEVSGSRGAELPARTETLVTHTLGRSFFDVFRVYRFTAMFTHTPLPHWLILDQYPVALVPHHFAPDNLPQRQTCLNKILRFTRRRFPRMAR
jgi:hypothetical protein